MISISHSRWNWFSIELSVSQKRRWRADNQWPSILSQVGSMNSESELKAKLNLSRSSGRISATKSRIAKVVLNPAAGLTEIVSSKVCMVENIEQLSSELNAIALFHF